MCSRLSTVSASATGCPQHGAAPAGPGTGAGQVAEAHNVLLAALIAAALCLHCRPASVAAAVGGQRASFLQRDKLYKQRTKQLAKQHPQPFVVRGHHLQLQALTSVAHCHHCDHVIWGLAPQAYVCTDCKLRVHRSCAKSVEEGCCLDGEHHSKRISRFMERIHPNPPNNQDSSDKKSRKSATGHFLNMERSFRKMEDEQPWDQTLTPATAQGEPRREGSTEEQPATDVDADADLPVKDTPDKDNNWRTAAGGGRGVNRAESCRERDAPRRGKHRNASDPNRLTAINHTDLEPGAATAPSGSSSSSSLSSRSNESNTVPAEQHASASDWSDEEEPLAAQWADSLPPRALDSLTLPARLRKRQEVIHELIVSEGSHVRWLKVLGGVFLRPLESQPSLLPPDELRALFPNLPGVRERHSKLYADLRALRTNAGNHYVNIKPVAEAMLGTLGDSGYAACLARFCRGQRMALDALKERRRKNKDLHQFLVSREQLPLCGRLQLRDLLACVWQRLTKYQLLLEGILKTVSEGETEDTTDVESEDTAENALLLRRALTVAKDVLHSVDTAIRTAENEHRLRSIQSKLEIRVPSVGGGEWDEPRRLDLTTRSLRLEGELSVRNDSAKKCSVLALMLEDCLVLLQREGEKFVLKPITQPSQQGLLSPVVKWDRVLFRPNAAVRNAFFLMNINGIQMHELHANTAAEYATWVRHMEELPLAKPELIKPSLTPSHQPSRSTDDSGINVSRNPSDASEKSTSSVADEDAERDRNSADRASDRERASVERCEEKEDKRSSEKEERRSVDKEEVTATEREEKHKPRRPTVGRISTHAAPPPAALAPPTALTVRPPAAAAADTARVAYTHQERLRRLDEGISRALRAKSAVVSELLGIAPDSFQQMAELAVADTLGQVDICSELLSSRLSPPADTDPGTCPGGAGTWPPAGAGTCPDDEVPATVDLHQLLLAAQAQANQLTESLSRALSVNEAGTVAARVRNTGRCGNCRASRTNTREPTEDKADDGIEADAEARLSEMLPTAPPHEQGGEPDMDDELESGAALATRLVPAACGLQATLARLLSALPTLQADTRAYRAALVAARERGDATRAYPITEEISFPKESVDQSLQEHPSNGG